MSGQRKKVTASSMILRGGLMNFRRSLRFASRYGLAVDALHDELGRLPTLSEYQDFMGLSRAQAFREQQAWRKCVGPDLGVLDVLSAEALANKGVTEDEREDAIARWLSGS